MLLHNSRRGYGHTRLVIGLTPPIVPARESESMNKGVLESLTHEIA